MARTAASPRLRTQGRHQRNKARPWRGNPNQHSDQDGGAIQHLLHRRRQRRSGVAGGLQGRRGDHRQAPLQSGEASANGLPKGSQATFWMLEETASLP